MAFAGFFSSAVTLATGEQRIMKATHPSARPRCIQSSENLEASCSLSLVWSCRSALKKSSSQPDMLQLRSMTARDFSLARFSCLRLSHAIRDSPDMWIGIMTEPFAAHLQCGQALPYVVVPTGAPTRFGCILLPQLRFAIMH